MEKMNTTKKIAVILAVMMVAAAMAAPAVMGAESDTATYSATVQGMQNTYISAFTNVDFGSVAAGSDFADNELHPSLTLTNEGNNDATVNAKFTTQAAAGGQNDYGLNGSTDILTAKVLIDGTNFKLGVDGFETALTNTSVNTPLTGSNVPASSSVDYDAQLRVPSNQKPDLYNGTVLLTFGNA